MTHEQKVNWLDTFENLLTKIEMSRKDADIDGVICLILIFRYLYLRLKEEVKNESDRQITNNV